MAHRSRGCAGRPARRRVPDVSSLHPAARALLESSALAHFVTVNRDGSPQLSCVWVGLDGDEVVAAHLFRSQKVKNLERDPRVVFSVEGTTTNGIGLRETPSCAGRPASRRAARRSSFSSSRTSTSGPG